MNDHHRQTQRMLSTLGAASRFRLALLLVGGERCVTDLARDVGLSQSCTTRHLQALQRGGVVIGVRAGKRVLFRLRSESNEVARLVAWALTSAAERVLDDAPQPQRRAMAPRRRPAPRRAARTADAAVRKQSVVVRARPKLERAAVSDSAALAENGVADADSLSDERAPAAPVRRGDLEDFLL